MANYGVNYRLDFCDKDLGRPCRIDILKRGYSGEVLPFVGGSEPMSISFKGDLDDKFNQIIGSQSKINLVTSDVLTLNNFYTGDERLYRVNLYINSVLEWTGFVTPDSAREPFLAPPYNATLTATDLLGSLKKVSYLDQSGSLIKKVDSIKNILLDCLAKTGLDLGLNIGVNTYEDTFLKGDNDCPLEQAYIDTNRFIDTNKKAYSCYDVIMHLCNEFTANIKQAHGAWWFVDIDQLRGASYRVRQFNKDGQKLGNVLISNIRKAGYKLAAEPGFKTPLSVVERDHETQNIPGYKSVTTYYQYGYLSNKLLNGDLNSVVTGPLLCPFENWYSLGGLVIGQGEKTEIIDNTNVPKPNGDKYAIIVNNQGPNNTLKVDMNKGMYTAPVSVLNTNRINVTVGIGTPVKMSNVAGFFTVKLTGVGEADHYWNKQAGQWQTEKIAIGVGPTSTSRDEVQLSFQMSPPPFSGFITFYIHGAASASALGSGNTQFFFNNVSIQFDESQLNKSPLGLVNIVNQIESYSESPEPIVLLFGDDTEAQRTSWMRNAAGVATKTWNGGKTLQSIVGRNILTQYQKTSRLFEGTFKGGASPLDVIQIDLTGGSFFFLSGEFYIKSGHAKLTLAELFIPDLVPINENSFLDYGDFKDKDGNGVGSSSGINIPPFIPSVDPDSFIRNQVAYQIDAVFNVKKGVFVSEMIAPLNPSTQVGAIWIGNPSDSGGSNPPAYVLEPATTSKLGGVIIGGGLSVDAAGRISVNAESPLTFSTPLVRSGNNVAIVQDANNRFVTDAQINAWFTKAQADSFYAFKDGSNASGTWGINITGNSYSATTWGGRGADLNTVNNLFDFMLVRSPDGISRLANIAGVQAWLGLGSFAYRNSISGKDVYTSIQFTSEDIGVASMLRWRAYGNGHVIFDASAGTAPDGTAINDTNSQNNWSSSFPTLMGWNGVQTYGVRVDSARNANLLDGFARDFHPNGNTIVARTEDGYIHARYFNMSAPNVDEVPMTDFVTTANDGFLRRSSDGTVRRFLGLDVGGVFHRYNTFTADANTVPENTSNFSYSLNAPWNGYLGHFGANGYGLQLSANYNTGSHISFRTKNGDAGQWNDWRELLWNGFNSQANLGSRLVVSGGYESNYNTADLQIQGGGTHAPNIAFHWAGVVASQISIQNSGRIEIRNNPGTGYENFIAAGITASSGFYTETDLGINWNKHGINLNSDGASDLYINSNSTVVSLRFLASGTSKGMVHGATNGDFGFLNSAGTWSLKRDVNTGYWHSDNFSAAGWFRTTGGGGWYHETYAGGIHMSDSTYVRVYNGKAFWVDNDIRGTQIISQYGGFKSGSEKGLVGNYDTAPGADKIIWTIGSSWNTLGNMYGLGYDYNVIAGFYHSLFMAENGVKTIHFSLANGGIYSVGKITGNELQAGSRLTIPVTAPSSPVPGDIWIG